MKNFSNLIFIFLECVCCGCFVFRFRFRGDGETAVGGGVFKRFLRVFADFGDDFRHRLFERG